MTYLAYTTRRKFNADHRFVSNWMFGGRFPASDATLAQRGAPLVAMDPSISTGFGHLMRLACLQRTLRMPTEMLGPVEARVCPTGLQVKARTRSRKPGPRTRIIIVDRNYIEGSTLAWHLKDRRNLLIWIRRGLVTPSQAIAQSGFLAFAKLVIVPGDLGVGDGDALQDLAARRGKLRTVGVCHAYQVVPPSKARWQRMAFLSLGVFEEQQIVIYRRICHALAKANVPFVWSAYSNVPLNHGFTARNRIAVAKGLWAKSECSALVSEGGYNSLHEALYLARPALFIANDGNGREQQSLRILAAKKLSPLVFDASSSSEIDDWITAVQDNPVTSENEGIADGIAHSGFEEMARVIEEFCVNH